MRTVQNLPDSLSLCCGKYLRYVIPVEGSSLYVVPLYLKAEGTNFLQLKRVIVAIGDKFVKEPTLDAGSG
jgi:uncharacterized membrane protein (UPF0182 family)